MSALEHAARMLADIDQALRAGNFRMAKALLDAARSIIEMHEQQPG